MRTTQGYERECERGGERGRGGAEGRKDDRECEKDKSRLAKRE